MTEPPSQFDASSNATPDQRRTGETAPRHGRSPAEWKAPRPRRLTLAGVAQWVRRIRRSVNSAYAQSTSTLVAAVDAKDPYTRVHSLAVAAYSGAIARRMGLAGGEVELVRSAALLHDVGKIGVPDAILTKPGPLTADEFEIVKRHPTAALEILAHVRALRSERPAILHHHERFDGRGYPEGLAGDRIPIGARIIAVADAVDTMLSVRSYKPTMRVDQVLAELSGNAGSQFDPDVVRAAVAWMGEWARETTATTPARLTPVSAASYR